MTLDQFQECAAKAIRSNFKYRNVRVFSGDVRHRQIKAQRRESLRQWCQSLRLSRNPETQGRVAELVLWRCA